MGYATSVLQQMFVRLSARMLVTCIAKTPAEITSIQRHRYSVFATELTQDRGGYDHVQKTLDLGFGKDPAVFDAYVGPAENPSASVLGRAYPQSEVPESDAVAYDLQCLPQLGKYRIAFLSHLVASKGARGSMTAISVISGAIEELIRNRGAGVVFIDCKPGLVQAYRKMGLRTYGAPTIPCVEGVLVPMMAIAGDVDWLKSIHSPLYPTLRNVERDGLTLPAALVEALTDLCENDDSIVVDPSEIAEGLDHALGNKTSNGKLIPVAIREQLAESGFVLSLKPGAELTRTGAADREMYVVLEGALRVSNGSVPLAICRVGELVGEVAFFWEEGRRSASMHAHGPTKVLVIRRNFVNRLKESNPKLAADFLQYAAGVLAARFADPTDWSFSSLD